MLSPVSRATWPIFAVPTFPAPIRRIQSGVDSRVKHRRGENYAPKRRSLPAQIDAPDARRVHEVFPPCGGREGSRYSLAPGTSHGNTLQRFSACALWAISSITF